MAMPKYHWRPTLPSKHRIFVPPTPAPTPAPSPAPTIVDMSVFMSPVEDQGNLGSCTSHALVGNLEYLENKAANTNNTHSNFVRLSRLFVYYNERVLEHTVSDDSGASITDAVNSLIQWGVCAETLWPYVIDMFATQPPIQAYSDGGTRKIKKYARVQQSENSVIACLNSGYPISFGFTAYESFEAPATTKTGQVPMPNTAKEKVLGGHAMLICGYNTATKVFKARNSWGPTWGDKGYAYFPWAYILDPDLASDFWTVEG